MKRFARDIGSIVVASIIVNWLLSAWDTAMLYPPRMSEPVSPIVLMPTRAPTFTAVPTTRPLPAAVPISTPVPTTPPGVQVIYVFNLAPLRIWFDKSDAIAYREAVLDGNPTRPYISPEKSRTVRGGKMMVLKQEDGLLMVKGVDDDVMGWIQ
jgi:hypothetical protein